MQEAVLSILIDPTIRQEDLVREKIIKEYTAGAPWFD